MPAKKSMCASPRVTLRDPNVVRVQTVGRRERQGGRRRRSRDDRYEREVSQRSGPSRRKSDGARSCRGSGPCVTGGVRSACVSSRRRHAFRPRAVRSDDEGRRPQGSPRRRRRRAARRDERSARLCPATRACGTVRNTNDRASSAEPPDCCQTRESRRDPKDQDDVIQDPDGLWRARCRRHRDQDETKSDSDWTMPSARSL